MKVAIFGGSFDPVHCEHVGLVRNAVSELGLDKIFVMPSYKAPHKHGARVSGKDRLAMCRIAFRGEPRVEVSDFELKAGGTSYSYLTCRALKERFPSAERFFLVGADMLENFFTWRMPEDILANVTLVACGRGGRDAAALHGRFRERFHCDFLELGFMGKEVSSTDICVKLAFGKEPAELDPEVLKYLRGRGLYRFPVQEQALALEKPARREHSYRVALLACRRSKSAGVPLKSALLAAMLHDCGKYVAPDDPLLQGFALPTGVPDPVVHQFTGAYIAGHVFGVKDKAVLNAIRYHTSGRPAMSELEKLIYLSDLLEEERSFDGVEALRELFWQDLDRCMCEALRMQMEYLSGQKAMLYPLTERAFRWYLRFENAKN